MLSFHAFILEVVSYQSPYFWSLCLWSSPTLQKVLIFYYMHLIRQTPCLKTVGFIYILYKLITCTYFLFLPNSIKMRVKKWKNSKGQREQERKHWQMWGWNYFILFLFTFSKGSYNSSIFPYMFWEKPTHSSHRIPSISRLGGAWSAEGRNESWDWKHRLFLESL